MELNEKNITMFGTQGCSDCQRSKKVLEAHHVAFDFVDLEVITDAAALAEQLDGRKSTPVISFPDGSVQVEPTDAELTSKLQELGLVS